MNINYTTSTVDSIHYKRLICGRTDDTAKLLGYIVSGLSVAIFGERRIGKTSLLYLIRDIINGSINVYQSELIDESLKNAIQNLEAKASNCIAAYLTLHDLNNVESKDFLQLTCHKIQNDTQLFSSNQGIVYPQHNSLVKTFEYINNILLRNSLQLVILIDEIELLLEMSNSQQLFRNLRGIIQSCTQIVFVLAGAEYWHKQIKDKTSPLVNNIQVFYLKSPARFAIENYLVKIPLQQYFVSTGKNAGTNTDIFVQTVIDWTGCKPYYTQAACQVLTELDIYTRNQQLAKGWQDLVVKDIEDSVEISLNNFYDNENLDVFSKQILILLANKSGLTVKQISNQLGCSSKIIWDRVDDLESLYKIRKQGSEYYIIGELIENWGRKTQDIPKTVNKWFQRLKWITITCLLLLAPYLYFYTHPPLDRFTCKFTGGEVVVQMPKSLEQNETGKAKIRASNTGKAKIKSLLITIQSTTINYQKEETNQIKIEPLNRGETKFVDMSFASHRSEQTNIFKSSISISKDNNQSNTCSFEILARIIPVKRYWGIVNFLLVTTSGVLARKDLFNLVSTTLPNLLGIEKKDQTIVVLKDDED
ncbi:MAG: HTH domain-containing protein [Moorea sp. SIO4A3]|nr:HTH domain-containing protein [Moorena sp. SIO4A3]